MPIRWRLLQQDIQRTMGFNGVTIGISQRSSTWFRFQKLIRQEMLYIAAAIAPQIFLYYFCQRGYVLAFVRLSVSTITNKVLNEF